MSRKKKDQQYGVSVDFDSTLHKAPKEDWVSHAHISGVPYPGAFLWLRRLLDRYKVHIFSVRNLEPEGVSAMKNWFTEHGMSPQEVCRLSFPVAKPLAVIYFDDRAWAFNGRDYPDPDMIAAWRPHDRNEATEKLMSVQDGPDFAMSELMEVIVARMSVSGVEIANVDIDMRVRMRDTSGKPYVLDMSCGRKVQNIPKTTKRR